MANKKQKKKRKVNTQNVVALSALIIGILTVFIYIYQARIMAKQHQDSVWPYVFYGRSIDIEDGLTISIYNKGIGPAIVKSLTIKSNGKEYDSWRAFLQSIELDSVKYSCSSVGVLSPQEKELIFQVADYNEAELVWKKMQNLSIEIIYCSIHEDCWEVDGDKREKTKSAKNKIVKCV